MVHRSPIPGGNNTHRLCVSGLAKWFVALVLLLILAGCNSRELLLDDDYNPRVTWGSHVVAEGETLYSVAMRYGWDYRNLAAANGIAPPYEIHPGDVIHLHKPVPSSTGAFAARNQDSASESESSDTNAASRSGGDESPKTSTSVSASSRETGDSNTALQAGNVSEDDVAWHWPHSGPIIAKYSSESADMNKGVDIGGDAGDAIAAAAGGNVVYAGSGLLGYGNLIIVNHSEHFLSAYAHNRTILVEEGEKVGQGDQIAEMGSTGADRIMLHFEIRRKGNPVDPMRYLPPR